MPEIKLDSVVSVSSEDPKYPATNLLGPVGSGKWKSKDTGEKTVSVILQLSGPSKLTAVHVGNEASAFIEVLVGKMTATSDQDWKVLLVASSLMTPSDARSNTNTQKVRMFGSEALNKTTKEEKWDRVKIVCTQPFNRSIAYGLSFFSLLSNENEEQKEDKSMKKSQKLGAFTLNDDTDSDDVVQSNKGAMFSDKARLEASDPPPTAAAAVRAAAREADTKVSVHSTANTSKSSSDSKKERSDKKDVNKPKKDSQPASNSTSSKKDSQPASNSTSSKKDSQPAKAKPSRESSTDASMPSKPDKGSRQTSVSLKEVFKGVVFSLSGFKNPKRSDLREKAMEMGAKYEPDWNKTCTHLICAYDNTPKFTQVNGKGYIVKEDWILDSYKHKSKQPWRKHRVARAKTPPLDKQNNEKPSTAATDRVKNNEDSKKKRNESAGEKRDVYAGSTDVDSSDAESKPPKKKVRKQEQESQDSDVTEIDSVDTDDEIAAHIAKTKSPNKGKSPANGKPKATKSSANDEIGEKSKRPLPKLPDLLTDKAFFLYGEIANRRSVYRYIYAYGGSVEEYMCDEVQYVITDESWDDNFDSALNDNANLIFVKSQWINEIHKKQKFIPHQKFVVVPT